MILEVFNSPGELVKFVNDQGILQAKIAKLWERGNKWYLFYFS
jgi:hypothetical protein